MTDSDFDAVIADLTDAQLHVISRCSDAENWCNRPFGYCRDWGDLVAHRSRCSMKSIRALIRKGIVFHHPRDGGYGLTDIGLTVQYRLRNTPPPPPKAA